MARKPASNGDASNGIGHNAATTDLTESERKSLFMHHFRGIQAQTARVQEQQAELKRLRSLAKADKLVLADIDFALRCAKVDDPSIIPAEIARRIEIARFFALPVGAQATMEFDREPANDKAKREGTAAFYAGHPREPSNYQPDSRAGQAFIKAWDAAEAQYNVDLASALQKTSAVRDMAADAETSAENMPPE